MRSEKKMFDLILGVARQDDRIRAAYMYCSRTNLKYLIHVRDTSRCEGNLLMEW